MIRNIKDTDYDYIIAQLDDWWGNRHMVDMLPRLFFEHFSNSSFVCELDSKPVGFLVGFISNTDKQTGYIHFVGVDPEYRARRVGFDLYQSFVKYCKDNEVLEIKCVTSPINAASMAFHHYLGFKASSYDSKGAPIPVIAYDGPGGDRVVFKLNL